MLYKDKQYMVVVHKQPHEDQCACHGCDLTHPCCLRANDAPLCADILHDRVNRGLSGMNFILKEVK